MFYNFYTRRGNVILRKYAVILFILFLLNTLTITAYSEIPIPVSLRTVQCGAFKTKSEAETCGMRLENLGFGPVWMKEDTDFIRVFVGKCETLTDAYILKRSLRRNGFPDAFSKSFPDLAKEEFKTEYFTPEPPLLLPNSKDILQDSEFNHETRQEAIVFSSLLSQKNDDIIISEGTSLINSLDDQDAMKGWIMIEVSKASVRKNKNSNTSVPYLIKISKGIVAANKEDRKEARMLAADSWHYYDFNPIKAYQAYKEILKEYENDEEVRSRALVEVAACTLELARSQKACFDEVRRACKIIMNTVPPEYKRAHAVADLMYCESFLYEGNKEKALELFLGFEERHPERPRETLMAYMMTGYIYGHQGDWNKCRTFYEKVIYTANNDPKEYFSWKGEPLNLRLRAVKWLQSFANQFNDKNTFEQYKAMRNSELFTQDEIIVNSDFSFPNQFYSEKIQ